MGYRVIYVPKLNLPKQNSEEKNATSSICAILASLIMFILAIVFVVRAFLEKNWFILIAAGICVWCALCTGVAALYPQPYFAFRLIWVPIIIGVALYYWYVEMTYFLALPFFESFILMLSPIKPDDHFDEHGAEKENV